ncbi:MAG: MFS transporter [Alphaproteobacteria bacterium]
MAGMVTVTDGREGSGWRRPEVLLLLLAAAMPLASSTWMALLNNFTVEEAGFNGADIGVLQSIREIPGLLAFTFIGLLFVFREQIIAYLSLILLGLGTIAFANYPTHFGLLATTFILSVGFHYYETASQSLALQFAEAKRAPLLIGRMMSTMGIGSIVAFALSWVGLKWLALDMATVMTLGGVATVAVTLFAWLAFPRYQGAVKQRRQFVLRRRYWLFYALTFMSGARRQIFVVFAAFLLVEKFGVSAEWIVVLFLVNQFANSLFAPVAGWIVARIGERRSFMFEYSGLIGIFAAYAFIDNVWVVAAFYVLDHIFYSLSMAMRTYFRKIADPADIAPSAGVALSISHIAAVFLPALYGMLWLWSPQAVFVSGAVLAGVSLAMSRLVPADPRPGNETTRVLPAAAPAPAE